MTRHFSEDFNRFFRELAANNHKAWFDENRQRYMTSVKEPFEDFVSELVAGLKDLDPDLESDPKKAIFRINRDIRFAKDKIPYKLNRAAFISASGRKAGTQPGFYVELGPEALRLGGGIYRPTKSGLQRVRSYVADRYRAFERAISADAFRRTFGEVRGNTNKRLPTKSLNEAAERHPILYNKQFFYTAEYPPELIEDAGLVSFVLSKFEDAAPVHEFLKKAAREEVNE